MPYRRDALSSRRLRRNDDRIKLSLADGDKWQIAPTCFVIPAKAGIHPSTTPGLAMDARFRGHDEKKGVG